MSAGRFSFTGPSVRPVLVLLLTMRIFTAQASGPFQPLPVVDRAVLDSLMGEGWVQGATVAGENTRLISSSLAVLLGPFGAHRLYLGTTPKVAVIYGITFGGFGVLAVVDLGHLLFTKDLDRYRNSDRVFMWSREKAEVTPP